MTFYDESLTLGQWLFPERQLALYKYFVRTKRARYLEDFHNLMRDGVLKRKIANGEILYQINNRCVSASARENGTNLYSTPIREIQLSRLYFYRASKLVKFFAQTEVDVISNFPIPTVDVPKNYSININAFPYYDLRYYSKGKSRIQGLLKKIQTDDSEIINKLMTN